MKPSPICLFWDNSNIFVAAKTVASSKEPSAAKNIRIQFDNLFKVATVGRKVTRAYCVGSVPPDLDLVWKSLTKATGVKPELYERGKDSGKEQGVDQCLQVWMLRSLVDISPPQTAVLLTGDGSGYMEGSGFHADLERLHKAGWGIEVVSWDVACAGALKRWAGTAGRYVKLEDYYESVTFVEGARTSMKPKLTSRQLSNPTRT